MSLIEEDILLEGLFNKPERDNNKKYITNSDLINIYNELREVCINYTAKTKQRITIFKPQKYKINQPVKKIGYGHYSNECYYGLKSYLSNIKINNDFIQSITVENINGVGVAVVAILKGTYYYWK